MSFISNKYIGPQQYSTSALKDANITRMADMPAILYRHFCKRAGFAQAQPFKYISRNNAEEILKYTIGDGLKIDIYEGIRGEIFNHIPNSQIVEEIVGTYRLCASVASYITTSLKICYINWSK